MTTYLSISSDLLHCVHMIGQEGGNVFTTVDKLSARGLDREHPVFGLKRDLINLLSNMCYRHRGNQDLVGTCVIRLKCTVLQC